jgi:hypothetical protein
MVDYRDVFQIAFLTYYGNGIQAVENNANGLPVYIGYAQAGTGKSEAKWQIRKITYDSNMGMTDVQFADGSTDFNKVWNLRNTAYTYS